VDLQASLIHIQMTCLGSLIHDYINLGLKLEQADDVGCSSNCGPRIINDGPLLLILEND
jgi:hypothetical protein